MMIELLIAFTFGLWLGARIKGLMMIMAFRNLLRDLGISQRHLIEFARKQGLEIPDPEEHPENPEEDKEEVQIKIEQHNDQLYAFRLDNDQFLGQGADRDSLLKRIAEQYKGMRFRVPKDQGADLLRENNG